MLLFVEDFGRSGGEGEEVEKVGGGWVGVKGGYGGGDEGVV